jgi:hypothetical protein
MVDFPNIYNFQKNQNNRTKGAGQIPTMIPGILYFILLPANSRCYRMLILNCKGVPVGKVISKNELRTSDEALATIWRKHIVRVSHTRKDHAPDPSSRTKVKAFLANHGYQGDPVE